MGKFRKIRNKCNKLILNAKQSYFDNISEKINTETNGSKNWWNLVKSLLHNDSAGVRSIPPLQVENDMMQDDNKKAEILMTILSNKLTLMILKPLCLILLIY